MTLVVKYKGDKEWEHESDLTSLGPINEPEWHKLWSMPSVPDLTSPPKGRQYRHKNVHNMSDDSSDEMD